MSGSSVLFVLAACVLVVTGGWFLAPKGNQQTLIRTSVILTVSCCYLMWAITYLAQLHPLIAPKRSDIRFHDSH